MGSGKEEKRVGGREDGGIAFMVLNGDGECLQTEAGHYLYSGGGSHVREVRRRGLVLFPGRCSCRSQRIQGAVLCCCWWGFERFCDLFTGAVDQKETMASRWPKNELNKDIVD